MSLGRVRSWLVGYGGVSVLLGVYWVLAVSATRHKCTTFDEVAHLTGGYSYWLRNDYRLDPESGHLPQRLGSLPLLVSRPNFPPATGPDWWRSDSWSVGDRFFYHSGNDADSMLLQGCAVMALLAVGLGLLVYSWSRSLFGPAGGLLSLVLCLFCPTMLAQGPLITSDMAVAFFFLAAVGAWWRLLHHLSLANIVWCFLALVGLFLSKFSAVLIVPIGLLLLALRVWHGTPLTWQFRRTGAIVGRWRHFGIFLVLFAAQGVLVAVALWAAFGFRYSAFAATTAGQDLLAPNGWDYILKNSGTVGAVVQAARDRRLLPEAYLYGFACIMKFSQVRSAFCNGQIRTSGWSWYFPFVFLVKTPLPMLAMLVAAVFSLRRRWAGAHGVDWAKVRMGFYATAPLWILLVSYTVFALTSKLNIGQCHILPVYPFLYILAGSAAVWLEGGPSTKGTATRTAPERPAFRPRYPIAFAIVALAAFLQVIVAIVAYPNYLAYFNEFVGGSRHAYRHLVDSNLDWGQDLPGLRQWLDEHGDKSRPVYLSYFGTGSPEYYRITARLLPCVFDQRARIDSVPLRPGTYCMSATMLQGVYNPFHGPWNPDLEERYQAAAWAVARFHATDNDPPARQELLKEAPWPRIFQEYDLLRFERLCEYLRKREPENNVGYSILIYRLGEDDLRAALE